MKFSHQFDGEKNYLIEYSIDELNVKRLILFSHLGNANLVYTIIRKRHVFHALANLPSDVQGISKCLNNRKLGIVCNQTVNRIKDSSTTSPTPERVKYNEDLPTAATKPLPEAEAEAEAEAEDEEEEEAPALETRSDIEDSMEGSRPALPAEPGTLKASLLDTPAIATMTERESAHPLQAPLCDFSPMNEHCDNTNVQNAEQSTQPLNRMNDPETPAPLKRSVTQVNKNCSNFKI